MTVAPPWPDHLLTLEEFDALPEDNTRRHEFQDGVLIVAPLSGSLHSRAAVRLMLSLGEHLPADWDVLPGVKVGIPHYWVVDVDSPISLTTYHRGVKGPAVTGQFTTTEPFPLSIDVAALTYRREDKR